MVGSSAEPYGWDDETLLSMLRIVFDDLDPVPDEAKTRARSMFALRSGSGAADPTARPAADAH